ncbi:hypothetical protein ACRE_090140 [Hapsidospora chrysogenum ATCC 11550]|uniref:Uncharacterized protein n=1 Tax=Hapsidospora chrysogenum (strain ATCC 11550 / CBS 779.69 / DSM 880 / IAM 14645 / JCM 23072 / IMI 49137) TaxID=857340 RepID=A0A086ST97_HAPC1|nr:hypothetical protein ACRE_090140 [Hapsidospora chrysogenum ATCC 11550]
MQLLRAATFLCLWATYSAAYPGASRIDRRAVQDRDNGLFQSGSPLDITENLLKFINYIRIPVVAERVNEDDSHDDPNLLESRADSGPAVVVTTNGLFRVATTTTGVFIQLLSSARAQAGATFGENADAATLGASALAMKVVSTPRTKGVLQTIGRPAALGSLAELADRASQFTSAITLARGPQTQDWGSFSALLGGSGEVANLFLAAYQFIIDNDLSAAAFQICIQHNPQTVVLAASLNVVRALGINAE